MVSPVAIFVSTVGGCLEAGVNNSAESASLARFAFLQLKRREMKLKLSGSGFGKNAERLCH